VTYQNSAKNGSATTENARAVAGASARNNAQELDASKKGQEGTLADQYFQDLTA
jgi:hypothetical protein